MTTNGKKRRRPLSHGILAVVATPRGRRRIKQATSDTPREQHVALTTRVVAAEGWKDGVREQRGADVNGGFRFPGPAEPEDSARDVRAKSSSGSTGPQTLRRSREFSLRRIFKDTEP
ncbi:uncharacterized protein LOC144136367 isoform X1 [Amblyomma americanum]